MDANMLDSPEKNSRDSHKMLLQRKCFIIENEISVYTGHCDSDLLVILHIKNFSFISIRLVLYI